MGDLNTANISEKLTFKKNLILRQTRRLGQAGRLELARKLRMSNSRVCDLVQEMLDEGLLIEKLAGSERRGRKAVPVMLNPEYSYLLGFDMEAKRLRLILADFAGNVVWQKQQALKKTTSRQNLIDKLLKFITEGLGEVKSTYRNILGIGLAGAGTIDTKQGLILHYDLIEGARDIPLRDLASSQTGLPCILEDNIRALTLAEWMAGAAQELQSFICLAVRSGVGAGIVIDGKLHLGSHGFAGETGSITLPIGSSMNQWKPLHDLVSEKALCVDTEANSYDLQKNKAAKAGQILGCHLASMASLLDPQAIVLAGGLVQPDAPLFDHITRTFKKFVLPDIADRVQLLPARLGPFAAAIGATHRCFQMLYPTEHNQI